jgi:hypothetical protein
MESAQAPRGSDAGRRWLFRLLILVGLGGVLEGGSFVIYWVREGRPFSFSRVRRHHDQAARLPAEVSDPAAHAVYSIHPYLGLVLNPFWEGKIPGDNPVTKYGFTGKGSIIHKRAEGRVIIGIAGGSVASHFSCQGVATLKKELKKSPRFSRKELVFVNIACPGYKQPQQIMALEYAMALGGEFDLLINLDGFNEIAWYPFEDRPVGAFYMFPRSWRLTALDLPDARQRRLTGEMAYYEDLRARWARALRAGPWRYSITANLIWKCRDQHLQNEITRSSLALRACKPASLPYSATGPGCSFRNDQEMWEGLAALWKRCSLQLERTCQGHGIRYYHFLQPNQYVPGSKEMGPGEKAIAYLEEVPTRDPVLQAYPLLRREGQDLVRQGIHFRDMTMVFAGIKEQTYVDNCCHYTQRGNDVLAAAIAQSILETPEPPLADPASAEGRARPRRTADRR